MDDTHDHPMDCCWACFHGKRVHTGYPQDPDCDEDCPASRMR